MMTQYIIPAASESSMTMKYFQVFNRLKSTDFSGKLSFSSIQGKAWNFYFSAGQIVYGTGGTHPGRRWRRYLIHHCPEIPVYVVAWQQDLDQIDVAEFGINCEYALLKYWVTK